MPVRVSNMWASVVAAIRNKSGVLPMGKMQAPLGPHDRCLTFLCRRTRLRRRDLDVDCPCILLPVQYMLLAFSISVRADHLYWSTMQHDMAWFVKRSIVGSAVTA
jgi:hypothetical protein